MCARVDGAALRRLFGILMLCLILASPASAGITFGDVPPSNFFYADISTIAEHGVTLGCGGGNYCPSQPVTREQMAAFIMRALKVFNPPPPTAQRFIDVPPENFFYAFIEQLAARGITVGCGTDPSGNRLYCPGDVVTRGQMAAFIMRAVGVTSPSTPAAQRFSDVPPSHPFYAFIEQMARRGVTLGCGGGNYCPDEAVTREQMAAFLVRGFGLADPGLPGGTFGNVSRFLEQSTWGPTPALVARVQEIGLRAYLDEQFAAPSSGYPSMPLQPTTIPMTCDATCRRDLYSMYPLQRRFFTNALYGEDQLRQRVAWALHKIIVVSGRDIMQPSWMVPYLQILDRQAFGNFRQLLHEITLNPAMGQYLDMRTSTRTNPNENYPREILQLFSIGTDRLNLDGTPQLDAQGAIIPTYDQNVIDGLTKVFTGWRLAAQPQPGVANYIDPMVLVANNHDTGAKLLLDGVQLPANQPADQDLNQALDIIFNHPNVGPFIAKQLIQQLVTSNPNPAYVERVAAVFNDNGAGVRGDLKAVVRAILLDPQARGEIKTDDLYGRLREPAQFVCNILRAFGARSAGGTGPSDGYLAPQTSTLEQDVLRPPTVFSYFPSDFVIPNSDGLPGPEFGILSASTALRRANFVNTIVFGSIAVGSNAPNGTSLDLAPLQALAGDPAQLVDEVARRLLHGAISSEMRASIIAATSAVAASNPLKRARTAIYLVASSAQYQVQR